DPDAPASPDLSPAAGPPSSSTPDPSPPDRPRTRYRDTRSRHADPLPAPAPVAAPPVPAPFDWERLVGVRLFAWLGGGALFLAAALFLHYSIQQNLIAPPVRVAVGLASGALALWGGDRIRSSARLAGEAICGAGVAILYAALFAARTLYELIPTPAAFAGMALVTLTAGLLAVRRDSFFVALLGLLGGMATPYLLSTGQDRPVALFVYVTLLSAGIVLVARVRRWPSLALIGFASALVVFVGWSMKFLAEPRAPYALGAVALVAALFAFAHGSAAAESGDAAAESRERLSRFLSAFAAVVPLATAIAFAARSELAVDPPVLAGYLLLVSGGSLIAAERTGAGKLPILAALLAMLALAVRVESALFPADRSLALACFAAVPVGFFAAWLARRTSANEVELRNAAVVALIGALPIVWLVGVTQPRSEPIAPTLAYAWLHSLALVAIGVLSQKGWLFGAAQLVAFLAAGQFPPNDPARVVEFVVPAAFGGLLFWVLPLAHARLRPDKAAWWSSAAALPLHFLLVYSFARSSWGNEPLGGAAMLCAVLTAVSLRGALAEDAPPEQRLSLSALFGALTLGFVTAAVPLLLENEWLTVSWAAEVAALAWLRRRIPHGGLLAAAALLAAGVLVRLLLNPAVWEYHERTAVPILNHYLYTFGAPALSFVLAARLLRGDELATRFRMPAALGAVAGLLLFVLVNVEIADYFSIGPHVTFRYSGGGLAEDMTYSLAWGAFAFGLLILGMALKSRLTRSGALLVLVLTIAKVFLHDLWELGSLYRVGSIVGLAVALLGVSFLTQRFVLPKEEK
ncbi:MAG TPA: DUF2339 domain-containing protein, partial [Polyangiaceae bacterium]